MSVYALIWTLKILTLVFAVLGNLFPNEMKPKSIIGRVICLVAALSCIGAIITL